MKKLVVLLGVAGAFGLLVVLWNATGRLNAVESRLEHLGRGVDTVSLTLGRALGRELLIQLPPSVEAEIREVEDRLGSESKWPTAAEAVQNLNRRLERAVGTLPPWAQEELLPRLLPRRWEISALWIATNAPTGDDAEGLSKYLSALEEHLASQPEAASKELRARLEAKKSEGEARLSDLERAAAVEGAKIAIRDKKDLAGAARLLAAYEDDEAKKLAKQLDELLTALAINEAVETVGLDLESARRLSDPELRVYALAKANQAAMELRLRASPLSDEGRAAIASLGELEKRIAAATVEASRLARASEAKRHKEYQVWALGQIKQVQTLAALEEAEVKKISSSVDRNNPLSDARKRARVAAQASLRSRLIDHLASIDQRLLDEAVGQWFRKVYQERFEHLSYDDQLAVVTGFAGTQKRQPD